MVAAARKRELGLERTRVRDASLRNLRSRKLLPIDCRLYRYFNNIGVRSFILTVALNHPIRGYLGLLHKRCRPAHGG
jgi:hypothetical protein